MRKMRKQKPISQIVTIPRVRKVKIRPNGKLRNLNKNGRTFETRFIPRYGKIPPLSESLPVPTFSESSNKILQERYLLKGGNLETAESVAERFWHVAYDIASGDFDFGVSKQEALRLAEDFYSIMVKQEFLPNSPTIMNAGKQNGLQYSACFVLPIGDSLPEIFDSVKYAALIHQTGGGCISADARVWTTFCGIEPIETLFLRATADDRNGIKRGQGISYDVSDLNIKTVAMNPQTAEVGLKNVTHVWQFDVPADQQILVTTYQGTKVQTSLWHPFMVLRGTKLVEMRADQLIKGDIILGPDKADSYWPWQDFRNVGSLTIDEDFGWLIGFTLGDGSFGYAKNLRQYRVRWFSGTEDVLKKVQAVLLKQNVKVSIQKDKRSLLSVTTLNQRFVHDLLEACGLEKFGPKDNLIRIPELIAKSSLPVVKAFLAGLLDSDGYVAPDGSPSYSTVSENMSQDLAALVGLLGFNPSVIAKEPYGKGKQKTYSVQICTLPQVNNLADELKPYLANSMRLLRLKSDCRRQTVLPLEFRSWRDLLFSFGLVHKRCNNVGPGPINKELNYWAAHGRIDRDSILVIANKLALVDRNTSLLLRRIAESGQEVKEVVKAPTPKRFYDLSVKDWNTYAAGSSGMLMIHNTGFSFSRLRPAGSVVKTTGGVASGPASFLRVFNSATESIKQGGMRRGANMGILRVDHPDILEFIRCKAELDDLNKPIFESISPLLPDDNVRHYLKTLLLDKQIANFNISVAITDSFMEALEKGEDYELVSPGTDEVTGKLNAKEVFDEIVERAWNTGDPGLIFIDRINKSPANPVPSLETIESTNPCVTGDTLITTKESLLSIKEIVENYSKGGKQYGKEISLVIDKRTLNLADDGTIFSHATEFYDVGIRDILKLITRSGLELKATADHKILTPSGWVQMQDLKIEDKVLVRSENLPNQFVDVVISVEKYGKERVYDLTEPISHSVIANGLIVHQCGEQPLAPWDACNLGSINLGKFVLEDGSGVDWERLREVTEKAVHFLDNVVQTNPFTLKQIYEEVQKNRRIGLGVMGWADMLFKLKIAYNSEEAITLAEEVMKFINQSGHNASVDLAKIRGSFPNWPYSIYAKKDPIRNSTITTIAPTGTISIIGDCSSGIEPVFALAYIHRAKSAGDQVRTLTIANQTFTEIAKREGFYNESLAQKVMDRGSVAGIDNVPSDWQKVFITASEISPDWHVRMQAAFQKYTDNGVSKTINLPNSATREDVRNAYLLAWQTGCNGITIYRDGSKSAQVLNVSKTLEQVAQSQDTQDTVVSRPMILRGRTYKLQTPVGEAFITINRDEKDQPFEVFVTVGKGGMHIMADAEAMGRLVSLSLRVARTGNIVDPKSVAAKIVQQLRGIGGASHVGFGKNRVMSLADAIAKVLAEDLAQAPPSQSAETLPLNLTQEFQVNDVVLSSSVQADLCPECGSASFVFEEGCKKCHSCGYSMC